MPGREAPEGIKRNVWTAVRELWPNFGEHPERLILPYIPVLPVFLQEASAEGRTPEWAAEEVTVFFLRIYIENALSAEERQARLIDLQKLSRQSLEEVEKEGVLPFTAAFTQAHATLRRWVTEGKLEGERVGLLDREVILALAGKPSGYLSPIGKIMLRKG